MNPTDVERRLAAILSADVVGYSRLMGQDDAATVSTLGTYRRVFVSQIESHRGRVVDAKGDALLAEFGSVVDAVSCAVEVQRELAERNVDLPEDRRMRFRIGVNLGEVIVQDDAIYGDGVNIAARLESLAEPGGICISGTAHNEVKNKLPLEFEFQGSQEVKNIADRVPVFRVLSLPGAAAERVVSASRLAGRKGRLIGLALSVVIVAAVIGAGVYVTWLVDRPPLEDPILAMPSGPTIAVLAFENMSGDPKQEYFSDGITEQIIAELTRFIHLHVLARNSTFQYKGKAVDVREIGRDLGARYVVEGSVRSTGGTIRVTVQLLDATDGKHLWAETYDRELTADNVFAVQDEITSRIVATIADSYGVIATTRLAEFERQGTGSLDAYECVLRAYEYYRVYLSPDKHREVRDCLERAVKADPNYADAWASLASVYNDEYELSFNPGLDPLDRAEHAARRAIRMEPANREAHLVLALVLFNRHDREALLVQADRALALHPNSPDMLAVIGQRLAYVGEWERGIALTRKAIALNPNPPGWMYFALSNDYYRRGEYQDALESALKINLPGFFWTHGLLAVIYGQLGRKDEAEAAVGKLLELYPDFPANGRVELQKWFWSEEEQLERWVHGWQKAGLDIPDEPEVDGFRKEPVPAEQQN